MEHWLVRILKIIRWALGEDGYINIMNKSGLISVIWSKKEWSLQSFKSKGLSGVMLFGLGFWRLIVLILVFALLSLCFMRQCLMKNASSPYIWVLLIWCRVNELRGDEKIRLKVVLLFGSLVVRSGSWIRTFRSEKVLLIILSLKSNIESCTVKTTVFNKRHNLISILHYQTAGIHYLFTTLPAGSMLINNKLITL